MKRSMLGSVLLTTGGLVVAFAPSNESSAHDAEPPQPRRVLATEGTQHYERLGLTPGVTAVNAGLKGVQTPEASVSNKVCGDNQVEVEGDYCPALEQKCVRWMDPETTVPRRCSEFAPTGKCQGKTTKKRFCIDKYEYPNVRGEKPVVMKSWYEAESACKAQGKRLCGDSEWTLACEGQERLPYPYGYERNSEACNIDKPHPNVNEVALANPLTRDAEVNRLWQGEASGTRESCASPFGAMDMTGNVDEWVVNESGTPYKSGLKGGYWGPVRDRCRPMTTAHYEQFAFYQIGFRCCSDPATAKPNASGGTPSGVKNPNPPPTGLTGS